MPENGVMHALVSRPAKLWAIGKVAPARLTAAEWLRTPEVWMARI